MFQLLLGKLEEYYSYFTLNSAYMNLVFSGRPAKRITLQTQTLCLSKVKFITFETKQA